MVQDTTEREKERRRSRGLCKVNIYGLQCGFRQELLRKFHHVRSGGEIRLVAVLPVINERHEMCHDPRERKRERGEREQRER